MEPSFSAGREQDFDMKKDIVIIKGEEVPYAELVDAIGNEIGKAFGLGILCGIIVGAIFWELWRG